MVQPMTDRELLDVRSQIDIQKANLLQKAMLDEMRKRRLLR